MKEEAIIPFLSIIENVALANRIKELEATIEAQEIIIKDKTAIMDAMAQPKTCDGCKYDTEFECTHWSAQQEDCCNRYPNLEDYYEPKVQP